jgi:predicted XRE-type DNA-binding protein
MIDYFDEEVLAKYEDLDSQTAVAEAMGISQSTVSKVLRRNGIRIGRGGKQRKFEDQQFLDLWNEHHDTKDVADRIGTSRAYVTQVLWAKFGIRCPKNNPNKLDLPMEEIKERYEAGESCAQIAVTFGLSAERIRRRLRGYGVERRSLKESVPRGKRNRFYKNGEGKKEVLHYYRRQSYEVAAICLGQPLPQGWIIHHLNENPKDNRPENLVLFQTSGAHASHHLQLRVLRQKGQPADAIRVALENGAQVLPQPPNPILLEPDTDQPDPSDSQPQPETFRQLSLSMS